ncbi:MAG: flagellar hook-length control protein FliK, partial [Peptostreptococcaceae bacterium]|nr:flagellar hook-length control protein FliK [Peptostreptococcaceae bacterium]
TDLKELRLRGIENASLNNNKEVNMDKQEKIASIKEMNEEKSIVVENGEMISNINKPGNIVNDQIEVNLKNQNLENVPVYNQIAEEIAAKLEQKGPAEFKLQLKPENLGEIDISIKISEGKLSIDIISANTKTQDLLAGQVDKLVAKLGLQNFQIENIQVNPGTTAGTTNHDATNQAAMLNLGMNFSDRRQQENLKQQSILKKELKGISGLSLDGKELNNSIEVSRGIDFSKHKINYAI